MKNCVQEAPCIFDMTAMKYSKHYIHKTAYTYNTFLQIQSQMLCLFKYYPTDSPYVCIYIYIYNIYVCVCVCIHIHTHNFFYVYVYIHTDKPRVPMV